MSEYQYYELQAIDRPLTPVRALYIAWLGCVQAGERKDDEPESAGRAPSASSSRRPNPEP